MAQNLNNQNQNEKIVKPIQSTSSVQGTQNASKNFATSSQKPVEGARDSEYEAEDAGMDESFESDDEQLNASDRDLDSDVESDSDFSDSARDGNRSEEASIKGGDRKRSSLN